MQRNRVDLIFAVVVPLLGLVGLTYLLRDVIDTGEMSYAQYVLPAVVVQAMLFGALTTTDRAAWDKITGLGYRLRTLPISPYSPLIARMNYCLIRGVVAITASFMGALFGFTLTPDSAYVTAFVLIALDPDPGAVARSGRHRNQGRAHRGRQPAADGAPTAAGAAVDRDGTARCISHVAASVRAHQPISQITETLRGFTIGQVDPGNLLTSLAWCIALLIASARSHFGCRGGHDEVGHRSSIRCSPKVGYSQAGCSPTGDGTRWFRCRPYSSRRGC